MTVGEPVGLREVKRHSSYHLPAAILTHQVTLPGTGWHWLIGLSIRMTSWSSAGFVQSFVRQPGFSATFVYLHVYRWKASRKKAVGARLIEVLGDCTLVIVLHDVQL